MFKEEFEVQPNERFSAQIVDVIARHFTVSDYFNVYRQWTLNSTDPKDLSALNQAPLS